MRPSREGIAGGSLAAVVVAPVDLPWVTKHELLLTNLASFCYDLTGRKHNKICFAEVMTSLFTCIGPVRFHQGLV